jgi:hypothetical protein
LLMNVMINGCLCIVSESLSTIIATNREKG